MASLNSDVDSQTQANGLSTTEKKTKRLPRRTSFKNILSSQSCESPKKPENKPSTSDGCIEDSDNSSTYESDSCNFDPFLSDGVGFSATNSSDANDSTQKKDAFRKLMATQRCQGRLIAKYRTMDQLNEVEEDSEQLFRKEKLRKERRPKVETSDAFTFLMTNRKEPQKPKKKRVSFSRQVSRILHNDRRVDYGPAEIPEVIKYIEQEEPIEKLITEREDINVLELFKEEISECVIPVVEKPDPLLGVPKKDIIPLRQPGFGRLLPIPVLAKIARKEKLEREKQPSISKFFNKKSNATDESVPSSSGQSFIGETLTVDSEDSSSVLPEVTKAPQITAEKGEEIPEEAQPTRRRSSRVSKKVTYFNFSEDSQHNADKENVEQNNRNSQKPGGSKGKEDETFGTPPKKPRLEEQKSTPKSTGGSKLASIFQKKSKELVSSPKTQISPSKLKARQDFLFAETEPDDLLSSQKSLDEDLPWPPFPAFSHVKQRTDTEPWDLAVPDLELSPPFDVIPTPPPEGPIEYMDKRNLPETDDLKKCPAIKPNAMFHILTHLKKKNPHFDVISTFKSYEKCKNEAVKSYLRDVAKESDEIMILSPEKETPGKRKSCLKLNKNKKRKTTKNDQETLSWQQWDPNSWVQLFAPKSSKQLIGNKEHVQQMKTWLEEHKGMCDSEDWYEKHCDDSSSSYHEGSSNTLLLTGPPGTGKTSMVYALAEELGFRVLEINASSRRSGKQVINQLSEATQSHSVSGNDLIKSSQEIVTPKRNLLKKKTAEVRTETEPRKNMALILFEDIDVVFEEYDEGFISAVNQLMISTKRPIILTCSSSSPTAWSKIRRNPQIIHLKPPPPEEIAQKLQLMSLANGVFTSATELELLIKSNNSDIRKSILDLQFWSLSGTTKIQWLKMECRNKNEETEDDRALKSIISCTSVRKIAETPISSLWFDSHINTIRNNMVSNSADCEPIDFHHIDPNLQILLPFNVEVNPKRLRYPLSPEDLLVKQAILKSSWICLEEESKQLNEIEEQLQKEETIKPPHVTADKEMIENLSVLYNHLTDMDILDLPKQRELSQRARFGTGLNDSFAIYDDISETQRNTMNDILSDMSLRTYKTTKKSIENFKGSIDYLNVTVHENPSISVHTRAGGENIIDVNNEIANFTPFGTRISRCVHSTDYLPYIRHFARCDELGKALQQTKRKKRHLGQLKQTGYYLSSETCVHAANMLS